MATQFNSMILDLAGGTGPRKFPNALTGIFVNGKYKTYCLQTHIYIYTFY